MNAKQWYQRSAKALTLASALITYAERSLRDLVRDHSGNGTKSSDHHHHHHPVGDQSDVRTRQRQLLGSIVSLLPPEKAALPINFLCCLLRSAVFLVASNSCKNELEKRISAILEHVTVDDLLVLSFTYDGEKLFDLESVRRIISGFAEKERSMSVFNGGGGDIFGGRSSDQNQVCSAAMQRVAKTVDAYLGEIATYPELSISKFNGIANLVPKGARKVEDELYRAIDIYLKVHPNLDEIEREKVCSVMDPLKLSYEARVHASQNKRLPVQIVLHALYYDQLKIRSGAADDHHQQQQDAAATRIQLKADVSLAKENEALRSELMKMKLYVSDMRQKNRGGGGGSGSSSSNSNNSKSRSSSSSSKHTTFFSSMSKTLGKLNPFRHGSKDTSNIVHDDDDALDITKPRRRRFSLS